MSPPIHAVTLDLLFRAKIEGAARAAGLPVPRFAPTPEQAAEAAAATPGSVLVVELGGRSGGIEAVERARALAPSSRLVVFGSHVDAATLRRARDLGAEAYPRSQFAGSIAAILAGPAAAEAGE